MSTTTPEAPLVTTPDSSWRVSVISHRHGVSVARVLQGLHQANSGLAIRYVVTINIPEDLSWLDQLPEGLKAQIEIRPNPRPQSFAKNHNDALRGSNETYLVAADPELVAPFPNLDQMRPVLDDAKVGLIAPQALDENGQLEDNGRDLPTPLSMIRRNLNRRQAQRHGASYSTTTQQPVAWLAGYFLACRQSVWAELGGFDTRYRMYCEDVDLGLRCWLSGHVVRLLGDMRVGHPARRATFNSWQHFGWHLRSLLRLWLSSTFREYQRRQVRCEVP